MNKGIYETGSYWVEQSTFFLTDSEWKAKHLVSLINSIPKSLLPQNRINIVEVGCGAGGVLYYFLRMMEQKGFYCHGVGYDISPVAIQKARELFAGIKYQVADITDIKKSDLLLISDVLEHVEGPSQFIRQCFDISPLVIIHLPLDYNYWGMLLRGKKYFEYLEKDRGHIHYFNKKSAFKLVNSAGAKVIAWKYTPWGIEHDFDNSRSGKLAKTLRSIGFGLNMDVSVLLLGGASLAMACCLQD